VASTAARWDPTQYERYAAERARPFDDLVARIIALRADLSAPRRVLDVGCGTGSQTATLAQRWPGASVVGTDSSPEMIERAQGRAVDGRPSFSVADVTETGVNEPVDVLVCNAVLQWVPDHLDVLARMAGWLAPGGVLAVQVPDNFTNPSHVAIRELRSSQRWADRLGAGADRHLAVERPERYLDVLAGAGLVPDVWSTTYLHLLPGADPVLEWVKGTALRPVLTALAGDDDAQREFLAELGDALRAAYPPGPHGTVFPFPRTFVVGQRPLA
jgi:trans-aconitate 2-methyltransferase